MVVVFENQEFKSFFKTVTTGEGQRCYYPTRLDTYGRGCAHDCAYCYAKSILSFRGLWNPLNPAVADIEKIRRTVEKKLKPGDVVRLGGMTDCFQPIERIKKVTYETIKILNEHDVHYLIVTKSNLVAEDEYIDIMRKDLAHIQMSVSAIDDKVALTIEKAVPPSKRLEAMEKLYAEGFDTELRISPLVPHEDFFNDRTIETIKKLKTDRILVEFLRINHWIEQWFPQIDTSLFTVKEGNYKHLPLEIKLKYLDKLSSTGKKVSVCEDVNDHYFWFKYNFNPNPNDCCNLRFINK